MNPSRKFRLHNTYNLYRSCLEDLELNIHKADWDRPHLWILFFFFLNGCVCLLLMQFTMKLTNNFGLVNIWSSTLCRKCLCRPAYCFRSTQLVHKDNEVHLQKGVLKAPGGSWDQAPIYICVNPTKAEATGASVAAPAPSNPKKRTHAQGKHCE